MQFGIESIYRMHESISLQIFPTFPMTDDKKEEKKYALTLKSHKQNVKRKTEETVLTDWHCKHRDTSQIKYSLIK